MRVSFDFLDTFWTFYKVSGAKLAELTRELIYRNLSTKKLLSVLPRELNEEVFMGLDPEFGLKFGKDVALVIDSRKLYEEESDELIQLFLDAKSEGQKVESRNNLRHFFAQRVKEQKWSMFNWIFITDCIILVF